MFVNSVIFKQEKIVMKESKAIKIFTKSKTKRKGKFINNPDKVDPRLGEHDDEADLAKLNRDAVKFLHISPEVERKEFGYSVGGRGLDVDYYQGG